jgi:anti-sigma regulatory factor (Ser/Thr protein kinase)
MTGTSREITEIVPMALDLPFIPESAGVARQQLVQWMGTLGVADESRDDARLVVSELIGNSVRDGGALTTPERVEAGVSDLAGRGLSIVETLASKWWVESTRSRTTVHALLALA